MTDYRVLGKLLRKAREDAKLTVERVAARVCAAWTSKSANAAWLGAVAHEVIMVENGDKPMTAGDLERYRAHLGLPNVPDAWYAAIDATPPDIATYATNPTRWAAIREVDALAADATKWCAVLPAVRDTRATLACLITIWETQGKTADPVAVIALQNAELSQRGRYSAAQYVLANEAMCVLDGRAADVIAGTAHASSAAETRIAALRRTLERASDHAVCLYADAAECARHAHEGCVERLVNKALADDRAAARGGVQ